MPSLTSFQARFDRAVAEEFAAPTPEPAPVLVEADLAAMPAPGPPVHRPVGRRRPPAPRNVRVEFDALMWSKPGAVADARARSIQYNFFDRPTRLSR